MEDRVIPQQERVIKIDEVSLSVATGTPTTFEGKLAGRPLAGIDLAVTVQRAQQVELIESLTERRDVDVTDPFVGRSYRASLRLRRSSYTEGQRARHYSLEVRELDESPEVRAIELNDRQYPVVKYTESVHGDGVARRAMLRLTPSELAEVRAMIRARGEIRVRRIDVDAQPFIARFGSSNYWSRHEENGEDYYKQIVRIFPLERTTNRNIDLASGVPQSNLIAMVAELTARFEGLVRTLAREGAIDAERRDLLLSENWHDLVGEERANELVWQTNRVDDAVEHID